MIVNRNLGWIGVDRGHATVKAAQLRKEGDSFVLEAAAITPRWNDTDCASAEKIRTECEALRSLAPEMKGKNAAAQLTMHECEIESRAQNDPLPRDEKACFDHWQSDQKEGYLLKTSAASVNALCHGMRRARMHCRVVDGAPLTLARALRMAPGVRHDDLTGALDIGHSGATFVVAQSGVTRYARQVSAIGFSDFSKALGATPSDAERFVLEHGLAPSEDATTTKLQTQLSREIRPLIDELKRTLLHLRGKLKCRGPEKVFLFGFGALAPGLADEVGQALDAKAKPWTAPGLINTRYEDLPLCLLGSAIALSALAWEAN